MDNQLLSLTRRIEKLEKAVFESEKTDKKIISVKASKSSGPAGGIKLLISKDFFSKKRFLNDIQEALEKAGYYYSIQVVNTAVTRLSKPSGPLVSLKDGGKKVYVNRK